MENFVHIVPIGSELIGNEIQWHALKSTGDQDKPLPRREVLLNDPFEQTPDLVLLQSHLRIAGLQIFDRVVGPSMADARFVDADMLPFLPPQLAEKEPDRDRCRPRRELAFSPECVDFLFDD